MEVSKKDKIMTAFKDLAKIVLGTDEVESIEAKFTDNKLADGTIVRYDADVVDVGVIVSVVGEDGSVLPLPLGSYVLEDGTTFDVVDDAGTADNVVLKEEEVMEEEGTPATPVVAEPKQTAKSIVESIVKETRFEKEVVAKPVAKAEVAEPIVSTEQTFASIKADFKKELKSISDKIESQEKLIAEMFSIIESYGTEGVVAPTEAKKDVFKRNVISKERAKELHNNFIAQLKGK